MQTFYFTDPGKVRTHNEDSVTILKNVNNESIRIAAKRIVNLSSGVASKGNFTS